MKPVIVYHQVKTGTDCPDGICAAWIAAKAFDFEAEVIGEIYRKQEDWEGYQLPFDPTDRIVVFVDWCGYPEGIYFTIAGAAQKVIILDHHKTAKEIIYDLSDRLPSVEGIYSPNEVACGATIAWDYFFPDEPRPWFLRYVLTRDTGAGGYWKGLLPNHEAVNGALSALRKNKVGVDAFVVFDALYQFGGEDLLEALGKPEVEHKNALAWAEVNGWLNNQQFVNPFEKYSHLLKDTEIKIEGESVPFLQIQDKKADYVYSWVGTYLSRICPNTPPYVLIVTAGDPLTVHLRKPANSKADCGAIAALFGGGGHKEAAGFSV